MGSIGKKRGVRMPKLIRPFEWKLPKAKKKRIEVTDKKGKKKTIKVLMSKPKRCSSVRLICVVCKKKPIHKLSSAYERKVCDACWNRGAPAPEPQGHRGRGSRRLNPDVPKGDL